MSGNSALEVRPVTGAIGSNTAIQQAINEVIGKHDGKVAFVAVADLHQARMAVLVNIGMGWSFSGFLAKPYQGQLTAGAELRLLIK